MAHSLEPATVQQRSFDSRTPDFDARIQALSERARTLPPGSDDETQDELGLILQLMPAVERSQDAALLGNMELAVHSLLAVPPNRLLAIRLRETCQQAVLRRGFFRAILPGTSASTWVVAGLASFLFVVFPSFFLVASALGEDIDNPAIAATMAGAVGSVVSIMIRIKDFTEIRILNPPALFWTGFFKPIIGAAFAAFVYFAITSDIVQLFDRAIQSKSFFMTLGFVAGFSERFAPDLVSTIERSLPDSARQGQKYRAGLDD